MIGSLDALRLFATGTGTGTDTGDVLINLVYLFAAVLFILGLKGLTHPRTAVRGNKLGAAGMFVAVVVTLWHNNVIEFHWILLGVIIGGAIGALLAIKVEMTKMPELVALFNGFGGIASILVAGAALADVGQMFPGQTLGLTLSEAHQTFSVNPQLTIAIGASGLIGAVTFFGSLVAFGKLSGKWVPGNAVIWARQQTMSGALVAACIGFGVWLAISPDAMLAYWLLVLCGSALGVITTIRIGGGDMPVVIALLNSYSGLAAAATGFVLSNNVLIVAGSLVGASGLILTQIMCRAMNRSLTSVLFGVFTVEKVDKSAADAIYAGKVKSTSADEVAMLFDGAQRVVFVPGYGMAVAQAQHTVRDLANLLMERGISVEYGIHPVAGRMPGHMNVLLAEADVPYEQLQEMDHINPTFPQVDVVIVIGANDVVNPVARTDPNSPIAGMPILDVDKARTVVIIKRSLSPGFAGIPNPLFAMPNTLMFFGDGKKNMLELIAAVKEG